MSKGLVDLGGKNCVINLVSNTGENKMKSVIGMCLFTQYYYWFPMIHMLNLSVYPTFLFNLDDQLKLPKNYKMLSKAKPSIFGYPKEEEKDKEKREKINKKRKREKENNFSNNNQNKRKKLF